MNEPLGRSKKTESSLPEIERQIIRPGVEGSKGEIPEQVKYVWQISVPWLEQEKVDPKKVKDFTRLVRLYFAPAHEEGGLLFRETRRAEHSTKSELKRLHEQYNSVLRKLEQFKTQSIHEKRAHRERVSQLEREREKNNKEIQHLRKQTNGQLNLISELLQANRGLQQALINHDAGKLCMHETHKGTVVRVIDEDVVVRYGSGKEAFEQVYDAKQFGSKKIPNEGDRIEVHLFAWKKKHFPEGIDKILSQEEQEELSQIADERESGPFEI